MQSSSSEFINVTNSWASASGCFLGLAETGQLMAVSKTIQNRANTAKKLAEVEAQLVACNNPVRLAELLIFCSTAKRDFKSRLRALVTNLEARKGRLLAELSKIDERLDKEHLDLGWAVDPAPMISLVPRIVRKSAPHVVERNAVIDEHLDLSDREICHLLDRNFVRDGYGCCDHLPERWVRDCRVDTFIGAYNHPQCRGRVHKLISVRRRLQRYPSAGVS